MKTTLLTVWVLSFIAMVITSASLSPLFGASVFAFTFTSVLLIKSDKKGAKK